MNRFTEMVLTDMNKKWEKALKIMIIYGEEQQHRGAKQTREREKARKSIIERKPDIRQ